MTPCPSPEALFHALDAGDEAALAHAAGCESCASMLEADRQLEKDLYRLTDPLPPSIFVSQVMARVDQAPVQPRLELKVGFSILSAAVAASGLLFWVAHGRLGAVGSSVASNVVSWHTLFSALANVLGAIWHTAAAPLTVALTVTLLAVLVGLRKMTQLALAPEGAEVS